MISRGQSSIALKVIGYIHTLAILKVAVKRLSARLLANPIVHTTTRKICIRKRKWRCSEIAKPKPSKSINRRMVLLLSPGSPRVAALGPRIAINFGAILEEASNPGRPPGKTDRGLGAGNEPWNQILQPCNAFNLFSLSELGSNKL
jgi:hypothetical protein